MNSFSAKCFIVNIPPVAQLFRLPTATFKNLASTEDCFSGIRRFWKFLVLQRKTGKTWVSRLFNLLYLPSHSPLSDSHGGWAWTKTQGVPKIYARLIFDAQYGFQGFTLLENLWYVFHLLLFLEDGCKHWCNFKKKKILYELSARPILILVSAHQIFVFSCLLHNLCALQKIGKHSVFVKNIPEK